MCLESIIIHEYYEKLSLNEVNVIMYHNNL